MGTDRFYSKKLSDDQLDRVDLIRQNFTQLYDYLDSEIPTSREKDIYTTKMEEACMWAVKAVSNYEPIEFEEFVPTTEQIAEQMKKIQDNLKKGVYE